MKHRAETLLSVVLMIVVVSGIHTLAAESIDSKTKAAKTEVMPGTKNEHNSAELTKWITAMKTCHVSGKNDVACHNRVIKSCEEKLTKNECSSLMSHLNTTPTPAQM